MKQKSALQKLEPLINLPSFTSDEAKKLGVSSALLSHYVSAGDLIRLSRGLYKGVQAQTCEDIRWEDLVIKVKAAKEGVICLISALALYGLTEEIPRQHWIAVANSTRYRTDSTVKVIRMRNIDLGKTEITIEGVKVPIFDQERTIVDAFKYLSIEIAIKALRFALQKKGKEKIDLNKMQKYAKMLRIKIEHYLISETT